MNILVITGLYSMHPKSGGSLIMKLYVEELRRQGHTVYLLYDTSEDKDPETAACQRGNYYMPAINNSLSAKRSMIGKGKAKLFQSIDRQKHKRLTSAEKEARQYFYRDFSYLKDWMAGFTKENPVDIIQVDFPWLMNLPQYLPAQIPKVFVSHETQAIRLKREAQQTTNTDKKKDLLARSKSFGHYEKLLGKDFNAILTLTDADRDVWEILLPGSYVITSPLGINIPPVKLSADKAEKIVFMGNGKHYPNVDGLQFFLTEIWPAIELGNKTIKLLITGNYDPELTKLTHSDRVTWEGFVDDLPTLLHNSISIVPIRIGSGIRIKVLEGMAMGSPVVSTTVGAEGIMAKDGESILFADDPKEFASKVLALSGDPTLYQKIGMHARQLIMNNYNLHDTVQNRITLFKNLRDPHFIKHSGL